MHSGDRNLLVGVLGLQMELISEAQLVSAMQAWIFKKPLKIEDILLDLKFIDNEKREFLAGLADRHIALHKDDPAKSLASLSSFEPVQKRLKDLEDEDIAQSITRIAEFRNENEPSSHFLNESTVALPAFFAASPMVDAAPLLASATELPAAFALSAAALALAPSATA